VFAKMLETNMTEVKTGRMIINDIGSKGMKELLNYMYTGSLKTDISLMQVDIIAELLDASEKV
jgi:hypothetical protein